MQINYLKKEMLAYELFTRGVTVDDSRTVEQLRSALRPLLKLEKGGKPLTVSVYTCDVDQELAYISATLQDISTAIKSMAPENAVAKFERNQTRLVHLLNRTDRIPLKDLSEQQLQQRGSFLAEILGLLDRLEIVSVIDPNVSALLAEGANVGHTSSSTPVKPTPVSILNQTSNVVPKSQPVQKWNLKFSGDLKVKSVHSFLEEVEELRIARHTTEEELFDSARDLFVGKALNWFRANRSRFSNWKELSDLLILHFQPPDYKARLFREILDRTQDPSEGIVDYLTTMNVLFRRYLNVPEEAQLEIIMRNLAPFYTTQLPVVNTLEELEVECLKLEAKKYRAEHYVPPPRRRVNLVEPDFTFVETSDTVPDVSALRLNEGSGAENSNRSRSSALCWNCQKPGHLNRECKQPKRLHCYRCGHSGSTSRNCPNCSVSGNGFRGNRS
nr:hypothetical protein [Rickettsia endosymbiont of Ceutorhynchus assimilis]